MKTPGATSTPILSDDDLKDFTSATNFAGRIEAAKRASTLAVERTCARGLTRDSAQCAEALFRFGETIAERDRGLQLLVQHLRSPQARVADCAIRIIKKATRRANVNAAAIGTALSDVRRARVASAEVKVS